MNEKYVLEINERVGAKLNRASDSVQRMVRKFPNLSAEAVDIMRSLYAGKPTYCQDGKICFELGIEGLAYIREWKTRRLAMTTVASDLIYIPNAESSYGRKEGSDAK